MINTIFTNVRRKCNLKKLILQTLKKTDNPDTVLQVIWLH